MSLLQLLENTLNLILEQQKIIDRLAGAAMSRSIKDNSKSSAR